MGYKLTHPDSKQEIEVDASVLETYQSQGWETAPQANPPADASDSGTKKK